MSKIKKSKILNYARFVSPDSSGSFVGFHGQMKQTGYCSISLTFADCNKKVDWEIPLSKEGLRKVRAAQEVLMRLSLELDAFLNDK